ncbi:hypothetical protein LLG10_03680 [bacterium]|nr:hypothetical protein [bacterium]
MIIIQANLFLVKQPLQDVFYQVCALTLIQKNAIWIDPALDNHLKACKQALSEDEKKLFTRFENDSLVTFTGYLAPKSASYGSHEEMILTLLNKILS